MIALCRYLVLALAGSALVYGQAINGSISGLVTDKSGASITEAKITVTDVDRNTVFSTLSNDTGFYLVSQLPIGRYRITAEKSGFRTYVLDAFPLAAEQRLYWSSATCATCCANVRTSGDGRNPYLSSGILLAARMK